MLALWKWGWAASKGSGPQSVIGALVLVALIVLILILKYWPQR